MDIYTNVVLSFHTKVPATKRQQIESTITDPQGKGWDIMTTKLSRN